MGFFFSFLAERWKDVPTPEPGVNPSHRDAPPEGGGAGSPFTISLIGLVRNTHAHTKKKSHERSLTSERAGCFRSVFYGIT